MQKVITTENIPIKMWLDVADGGAIAQAKNLANLPFASKINVKYEPVINIAHNYASWETHFNKKVILHRKGATSAKAGEIGTIPGSQGTKSYIAEGLGNPESFMSCSHGAGRVMGRKQAVCTLNLEEEQRKLDNQGIIHAIYTQQDLEEASSACKDISQVMAFQNDPVKIKVELSPMAVAKGQEF
jgi:tRNA-splicing ligase RtcB